MAKKTSEKARICVTGESPLVGDYASLCARHGYSVFVKGIPSKKSKSGKTEFEVTQSIPKDCSLGIELTNTDLHAKRENLEKLDAALPPTSALLSSSVAVAASEQSGWIKGKHRLVGFGALPTLTERPLVEVAPTVFSPKETLEVVSMFFRSIGKEIEIVQDRVGLVMPRILCQLVNESMFALMEEVATPQDIDAAMKLGANYPRGPVEWAEKIGIRQIHAVLNALHRDLNEERYRVAPLLKQLAETNQP